MKEDGGINFLVTVLVYFQVSVIGPVKITYVSEVRCAEVLC